MFSEAVQKLVHLDMIFQECSYRVNHAFGKVINVLIMTEVNKIKITVLPLMAKYKKGVSGE